MVVLGRPIIGRHKADRALLDGFGRRHQFADGVKNLFQLHTGIMLESVVLQGHQLGLVLQVVEAQGQFLVRDDQLAQLHKGAHDIHRHLRAFLTLPLRTVR